MSNDSNCEPTFHYSFFWKLLFFFILMVFSLLIEHFKLFLWEDRIELRIVRTLRIYRSAIEMRVENYVKDNIIY